MKCNGCGKEKKELCSDGYCRKCHVSISFEDCINKTFEAKKLLSSFPRCWVKKLYPDAGI